MDWIGTSSVWSPSSLFIVFTSVASSITNHLYLRPKILMEQPLYHTIPTSLSLVISLLSIYTRTHASNTLPQLFPIPCYPTLTSTRNTHAHYTPTIQSPHRRYHRISSPISPRKQNLLLFLFPPFFKRSPNVDYAPSLAFPPNLCPHPCTQHCSASATYAQVAPRCFYISPKSPSQCLLLFSPHQLATMNANRKTARGPRLAPAPFLIISLVF